MPIQESRQPFRLRSLMLALPMISLLSSTIINLEWMQSISVRGNFYGVQPCCRRLQNFIQCSGFLMWVRRRQSEREERQMVQYYQQSWILITADFSSRTSPQNPGSKGMKMTTLKGNLAAWARLMRSANFSTIKFSLQMKNWFQIQINLSEFSIICRQALQILCSFCIRPWLQVAELLKNCCLYLPYLEQSFQLATSRHLPSSRFQVMNSMNFFGMLFRFQRMTCMRGMLKEPIFTTLQFKYFQQYYYQTRLSTKTSSTSDVYFRSPNIGTTLLSRSLQMVVLELKWQVCRPDKVRSQLSSKFICEITKFQYVVKCRARSWTELPLICTATSCHGILGCVLGSRLHIIKFLGKQISVILRLQKSAPLHKFLSLVSICSEVSHLPQQISRPPIKAIFWSTSTIFSWWLQKKGMTMQLGCRITLIFLCRRMRCFYAYQLSLLMATLGYWQRIIQINTPLFAASSSTLSNRYYECSRF